MKFLFTLLTLGILMACTQDHRLTPEQIAKKRVRNSAVRLFTEKYLGNGIGSGFFVAPGEIVTNIHVVAGATVVTIQSIGKQTKYTIEGVTAFDTENDLVILKIAEKGAKPLPLGDSRDVDPGTSIYALGAPDGEKGQVTLGTVHSIRRSDKRFRLIQHSDKWFRLKGTFSPGISGGPVLSRNKAEVIGITDSGIMEGAMVYAIPSKTLAKLLKRQGKLEDFFQWQKKPQIQVYALLTLVSGIKLSDTDEADEVEKAMIISLTKAIDLNPNFADAYMRRGQLLMDRGDYKAAIKDFDEVIEELIPDNSVAYNSRGHAKAEDGQYAEAIKDYTEYIQLIPDDASGFYHRGLTKVEFGRSIILTDSKASGEAIPLFEEGVEDFDKAIDLDPKYAMAYYSRAQAQRILAVYYNLQKNKVEARHLYKAAISDYEQAITLKPDYTDAYNNMDAAKKALEELRK